MLAAICSLKEDKAPGLDGFPIKFYAEFWEVIGEDVMAALNEFNQSVAWCWSLNSSFLAVILKKKGAAEMKDFRPITLLGSLYKILAKVLAKGLEEVMDGIISQCSVPL